MSTLYITHPVVSVDWLFQNRNADNLVILDASMKKATETDADLATVQIPQARFFDIKNVFSNTADPFPNAVPKVSQFNEEAKKLGINTDSAIVAYDDKGLYSSARVWWLFKAFGHDNVAVLDGGLPEWLRHKHPVEPKIKHTVESGNFEGRYNPNYFQFFEDIQSMINKNDHLILDARSRDRFKGLVPEPREGLRSGSIPNSVNLPYTDLLRENKLKPKAELKAIFNTFDSKEKPFVFSCGSGITACILALAADICGYGNLSVYDGSWTEYGSLTTS